MGSSIDIGAYEVNTIIDHDGDGTPTDCDCAPYNPFVGGDRICCLLGLDKGAAYITKMRVTNGGVNNNTGDDYGYGDYTNLIVQNNNVSKYKVVLKGVSPGNVKRYWRIYIDLNGNYQWDPGEKVYQKATKKTAKGYFTVPRSHPSGDYLMRVVMSTGGYAGPCENPDYGEIEDYIFRQSNNRIIDDFGFEPDKKVVTDGVLVYPNPFNDLVSLDWHGSISPELITVYNSQGQLIWTQKIDQNTSQGGSIQLQMVDWVPGTYFIRIYHPENTEVIQLIKM